MKFLRLSFILCISAALLLVTGCGGSSEEDHFVFDDQNQNIATNPNPPAETPSPTDPADPTEPVARAPSAETGSSENFVWKPISEADGNAVVLLPASSSASELLLFGPFGEERGSYQGRTNGSRPTFRFSLPGCAYAPYVQTEADDGNSVFIETPCDRLEF